MTWQISIFCYYLTHTVKTYVLHFQLSGTLSRLAEHSIANTRPYSTLLPICRIQSSSSKCFHCNTAELCNFSTNAKFSGPSPVIVGKCRICQHFLQLHGLHKRPGLLFELMCCATLLRSGGCLHIFFWVTHLEQELIVAIKFYFLLFLYQHHHQPSPCPSKSNVQISHR